LLNVTKCHVLQIRSSFIKSTYVLCTFEFIQHIYHFPLLNCLSFGQKPLIIMYPDDIILVARSDKLDKCEQEMNWLGITIVDQCEEVVLYASWPTL